jgi:pimeloyl-ACP methyl ester carboxylesterase
MPNLPAHRITGEAGPFVLLLHGIGGGAAMWAPRAEGGSGTAQALAAAGFRAVAVDLPGYGDSAALKPCGLACMAQQVRALAEALSPAAPWALVGHSMGGMVAQVLAARLVAEGQGARLAALVLACTSAAFGPPGGGWQEKFVADRLAPLDAGLGIAGMAQRVVPPMLGPLAEAGAGERAIAVMQRVPEATYRTVLAAIAAFDGRDALPALGAVPVLCLAGGADPTAPPAVMQRMAARIAGAAFHAIEGAGHIANLERPEAFDAALIHFLRHRTAPGA